MNNLLKAEMMKLRKHRTYAVLVILTAFQGLITPFTNDGATGAETFMNIYQGQEYLTLMLFFSALAGTFIAYDFEQGVFKHPIAFGHKKSHVVLSKFLTYLMGCCFISVIVPILAVAVSTFQNGFGAHTIHLSVQQMWITSLLMTLVYMGIASLAAALAFVSRSAIVTVTTFVGIDLLRRLITIVAVRNERVSELYSKTIFYQSNTILYDTLNTSAYTQVILVSLFTILVAVGVSVICIKQFDIK